MKKFIYPKDLPPGNTGREECKMRKSDNVPKEGVEKSYISNDVRAKAYCLLLDAVTEIAKKCIELSLEEDPAELIRLTERSEHVHHHQKYQLDNIIENITNDVIRPKVEQLERLELSVARRVEHSPDRVLDPERRYYLLMNPIEGSDNFVNAIRHRALLRKRDKNPKKLNPQACITLALIDKEDPFHPITTAVYHFFNEEVYGAITVIGPKGELTPWAFLGKERAFTGTQEEEKTPMYGNRDFTIFVADYKFNFRKGIEAFQTSLIKYGLEKKVQNIDPTGGQCCTASNILQVIDGEGYDGYIDARALFENPPSIGRYAKLLYTNAISVLPIAEGFGFKVTNIDGQSLTAPKDFDLSNKEDRKGNPEITLVIARPRYFEAGSQYNVIEALREGKHEALTAWEAYKEEKRSKSSK